MSKWEPTRNELEQVYSYVEWLEDENSKLKSEKNQLMIKCSNFAKALKQLKKEVEFCQSKYESLKETAKCNENPKKAIARVNESELYYRSLAKKYLDERNELKKRLKELRGNAKNR